MSSIGSARPSWLSPVVRCTTLPPSWYMPASKLTRVRVEAFSKIIASVRSASGWYFSYALNFFLMMAARSNSQAYSSAPRSLNWR